MAAFAILSVGRNRAIERVVVAVYPKTHVVISSHAWLVADVGVGVRGVCDKLKLKSLSGDAIVIEIDLRRCHGFAGASLWNWLKMTAGEWAATEAEAAADRA